MSFNWSQTLRTAEKQLARGRILAAIEEYQRLSNWDPTDLTILNTLGDLYIRAGRIEDAGRIFARVAAGYRHQGFNSKAIAILKKLMRIAPDNLESSAILAECYLSQGLRVEASRQFLEVAQAYNRAGKEDKAIDIYQRMLVADPTDTSLLMCLAERWARDGLLHRAHENFMAAGAEYSRRGMNDLALSTYLKAQGVKPDEQQTLSAISSICTAMGKPESAIPILLESTSRIPSNQDLYKILGSLYLAANRLEDASQTFRTLLTIAPSEYPRLLLLAERYLIADNLDSAVEQISGIVDGLMTNRNEQPAVDFLNKVLDQNPQHHAALSMLAHIYRRLRSEFNLIRTLKTLVDGAMSRGDRTEAIELLKELCTLEPNKQTHRDVLNSLGVDTRSIPAVIYPVVTGPALKKTGNNPHRALLRSAAEWTRAGNFDAALALVKAALKVEPNSLRLRYALKQIYKRAGMIEMAANECLQIGRIRESLRPIESTLQNSDAQDEMDYNSDLTFEGLELITASERRKKSRVPMRVPLVVISETAGWREFTETVDVSEEGLRLRLVHQPATEAVLRLLLETSKLPEQVSNMAALTASTGIVRHCRTVPGKPNLIGVDLSSESIRLSSRLLSAKEFLDHSTLVN